MSLDEIRTTFFIECSDLLAELEEGLFSISPENPDLETINQIFRAVHSIKGGAGAFALDDLVSFAHVFENALDVLRNDVSQSSEDRIQLLQRAADTLNDIVSVSKNGGDPVECQEISEALEAEFDLNSNEEEQDEEVEFAAVPISIEELNIETEPSGDSYSIRFAPKPDLYLRGHDPQRIFRDLASVGEVQIKANTDEIESLDKIDLTKTFLSWDIQLSTQSTSDEVEAVFEWVEDLSDLSITNNSGGDALDLDIEDFFDEAPDSNTTDELATEPIISDSEQENIPTPTAVEEPAEQDAKGEQTSAKTPAKEEVAKQSKPIRVDAGKVDRLINLMGELVISQSMLSLQILESGTGNSTPTGIALNELQNLTREIQSSVMSIRAQPIKPVFMRMSRVVREVCGSTGKKANLILEGEHTEVDTTVIEGLSDPLTHLIRNSVDHGVEDVETRLNAGKPEHGEIKLSASHGSGSILIQISDDGGGINREKVKEIAINKGVIQPDAKLTDPEIDNLIFAPGFSTAEQVTDVSGRGVGMDVVRQSIQSLGGRVSIESEPGKGSVFSLKLPLTLAILEGMLVQVGSHKFVVPVSSVMETISLKPGDTHIIGESKRVFRLRDQLVPIINVGDALSFTDGDSESESGIVLVVDNGSGSLSALLVDSIIGQQQVVIKSMESSYRKIPCIAAATILGDGSIALILNVEEIVAQRSETQSQAPTLDQVA